MSSRTVGKKDRGQTPAIEKHREAMIARTAGQTWEWIVEEYGYRNVTAARNGVWEAASHLATPDLVAADRAIELRRIDALLTNTYASALIAGDRDAARTYMDLVKLRMLVAGANSKESVAAEATMPGVLIGQMNVHIGELTDAAANWVDVSDDLVDRAAAHYAGIADGPFRALPRPVQLDPDDEDDVIGEYAEAEIVDEEIAPGSYIDTAKVDEATHALDLARTIKPEPVPTPRRVMRLTD